MNTSCSTSCSRAARGSRTSRRLLAAVLAMLSVAAWAMPVLATQTVTTRHAAVKQPAVKHAEGRASVRSPAGTAPSPRPSVARKTAKAERKHYANGAACELTQPRSTRPSATRGKSATAGKSKHKRHDTGFASFYGQECANRPTANGERFDPRAMTAAHRTLPFGTRVRVTNLENGRQVVVRINDRGPYRKGRVLDLSRAAARKLGFVDDGVAHVRIEVLKERKSHHREWRPGELAVSTEPATPSGS